MCSPVFSASESCKSHTPGVACHLCASGSLLPRKWWQDGNPASDIRRLAEGRRGVRTQRHFLLFLRSHQRLAAWPHQQGGDGVSGLTSVASPPQTASLLVTYSHVITAQLPLCPSARGSWAGRGVGPSASNTSFIKR